MKALSLLVVLLAGCAAGTGGDLQTVRDPWYGTTYDEVVARWGTPIRYTTLADGGYVYTWEAEGVVPRAGVYPSIGLGFFSGGRVSIGTGVAVAPGGGDLARCDRTLVFREGRVAEQTWQGDPDYCTNFRK